MFGHFGAKPCVIQGRFEDAIWICTGAVPAAGTRAAPRALLVR